MKFLAKTALPLVAALALTFSAASAQTTPAPVQQPGLGQHRQHTPQEMAQHQTQRLSKHLGLSAQQQGQVQQIMQQRAQEWQALRAQAPAGTDRQQLHTQMQANRAKYDAQLKGVLTPEQFGKYTAMRSEHHHHGHGGKKMQPKTTQS